MTEWGPGLWVPSALLATTDTPNSAYLTFDDGPGPNTAPLSRLLQERSMTATFFFLGSQLAGQEDVVAQVLADGHTIGVHGMHHRDAWTVAPALAKRDLLEGFDRLSLLLDGSPKWIRPPFGHITPWTLKFAKEKGLQTVLWNLNPADYSARSSARGVQEYVVRWARPGSVVLLHENGPVWGAFNSDMPRFLDALIEKGLTSRGLSRATMGHFHD